MVRERDRSSGAGFTLVELLVVLMFVGAMAAIAMPHVDVARMRVQQGAREGATFLLAARQRAVLGQHDVVVTFDTAQHMAQLFEDDNDNGVRDPGETEQAWQLPEGIVFGRGTAPAGPAGSAAVGFSAVSGEPRLVFHRNGSSSERAGLYLTTTRGVRAQAYAEDARALEVERATGRVSIYEYKASGWTRIF